MGFGGSASAMIMTIRNNAKLLNRNNLFSELKKIERKNGSYEGTSLSAKELKVERESTKDMIKKDRIVRFVIGFLTLIPLCFVLYFMFYLIVAKTIF